MSKTTTEKGQTMIAKTYSEIFVTQTDKGPRFYRMGGPGQFRTFPVSREVAEASFAAGATVYRKERGVHVFTAIERIDG
jgi:hypothetical protein